MNGVIKLATAAALAVGTTLCAKTVIRIADGPEKTVAKEVLGVNQLAYGQDSFGFLQPGRKVVQPEMIQILKEIGVHSMRYPGGCGGTHLYDWKKSAGLNGDYAGLGLIQFLNVCEEIGAIPMLGLSAFRGSPTEAAEFVEFLNMPDDGKNKWAAERTKLGHPKPYHVRYIEYGNESYHGNHLVKPTQPLSPEEYARNYLAFRKAMKAIDPEIQLGLVLNSEEEWNLPVLKLVRNEFDFVIRHFYQDVQPYLETEYIENFSGAENLRKELNAIRQTIPRPDLQIAMTEFNSTLKRHHSLTAALYNASLLQTYIEYPGIFAAMYWQFCNEGFGMVRGRTPGEIVKRPNALMYELFSANLLERLLPIRIEGRMTPTRTKPALTMKEKKLNLFQGAKWYWSDKTKNAEMQTLPGNVLKVEFLNDAPMNFFHIGMRRNIPNGDVCAYRLTAEIRTEGMEATSGAFLQFGDGRGWKLTESIVNTEHVLSDQWVPVNAFYQNPLPDVKALEVKVRRASGGGKGAIYVRNLKVTQEPRNVKSDKVVAGMLTASKDGKTLALLLTNRSFTPETVVFDPASSSAFRNSAVSETAARALTGPDAYADNEEKPDNVAIVPIMTTHIDGKIRLTLPPHSLTGVRIRLK